MNFGRYLGLVGCRSGALSRGPRCRATVRPVSMVGYSLLFIQLLSLGRDKFLVRNPRKMAPALHKEFNKQLKEEYENERKIASIFVADEMGLGE